MIAQCGDQRGHRSDMHHGVRVRHDDRVGGTAQRSDPSVDACTEPQVATRVDDPHLRRHLTEGAGSGSRVAVLNDHDLGDALGEERGDAATEEWPDVVVDHHCSRTRHEGIPHS